ncbi:heavy metal sensor histidine kinase [Psychromonas sp.]|uniref:heavy metal sensor histidine kinase n=1 Tax=Psychromonas sp. TaxID=1884585 RepID=UPI003567BEA3
MILQRSLTLRLTSFFSIATVLVITGLSWLIHHEIEGYFYKEDRVILNSKINMLKDVIARTGFNSEFPKILKGLEKNEGVAIKIDNPDDQIALYVSEHIRFPGDILFGAEPVIINPVDHKQSSSYQSVAGMLSRQESLLEWQDQDNLYRGMQYHLTLANANHSSVLVTMAININHHREFLHNFGTILIKFTVIAAIISALLSWFLTYRGLLPLQQLCTKAKLVTGKDIKQRMPVDNLPVEIAGLSHTLNNMLERLQDAFVRLENFSSDIAHELRTPINNLMMQTQVALSQPRSKDEYLHTLGSNAEEFERLARMISDMLYLAKTENEQVLINSEDILLEQEIANLLEYYEMLAEDRNITLTLEGEAKVQGDKLMLRRAFSNLISNAIKNSFEGGEININIYTSKQSVVVYVINHGETIPAEILPHLFDRFYRADKARTCCLSEGVGLGLAITQSIAKQHGGKVSVRSEDNLTTFTFAI